jgi:hypothetical protein
MFAHGLAGVHDGILGCIGEENIHRGIDHAVKAQIAADGDSHADL